MQIQDQLDEREWWTGFPPEGVEVVSWVVATSTVTAPRRTSRRHPANQAGTETE